MFVAGSVVPKRMHVVSFGRPEADAVAAPVALRMRGGGLEEILGEEGTGMELAAVQQRWFSLLTNFFEHPIYFSGTNLTEFEISFDGSVKRLTCVQKSGSTVFDMTCMTAIDSPAPFRRWPGSQAQDKDATHTIRLEFILPESKN